MTPFVIVGTGGMGRELLGWIAGCHEKTRTRFRVVAFISEADDAGGVVYDVPVVHPANWTGAPPRFVIAFADPARKKRLALELEAMVYDVERKRVRKEGVERTYTHVHVQERFPVFALGVDDAALPQLVATAERLAAQGADVFLTGGTAKGATTLPSVAGLHPLVAPLTLIVGFYGFIEALARRRGFDPDTPPHLRKVTETL